MEYGVVKTLEVKALVSGVWRSPIEDDCVSLEFTVLMRDVMDLLDGPVRSVPCGTLGRYSRINNTETI